MTGPEAPGLTFLICSERSGSNLLTGLMNAHPQVSAPSPTHLFRLFALNAGNYGDLANDANWRVLAEDTAAAFGAILGRWRTTTDAGTLLRNTRRRGPLEPVLSLYRAEAALGGAREVFVKENHTARFAARLRQALPACRFVWMVRDPRDVAVSYLETDGIPGGVERAAEVWRADQTDALALFADPGFSPRIHRLTYEALIADPQAQLAAICRFLDLPFDPAMLRHHESAAIRQNAGAVAAWGNLAKPILKGNAGKFRTALTPEEIEYVELSCAAGMRALGYAPVTAARAAGADAARAKALRPRLRPGRYRLDAPDERDRRARRLAAIERVKARDLR